MSLLSQHMQISLRCYSVLLHIYIAYVYFNIIQLISMWKFKIYILREIAQNVHIRIMMMFNVSNRERIARTAERLHHRPVIHNIARIARDCVQYWPSHTAAWLPAANPACCMLLIATLNTVLITRTVSVQFITDIN